MIRRNYYFILGVLPTESTSGLRRAFRTLVKRYHPERAGPRGMRLFQEILEAYHVLADPLQRSSYDRGLAHAEGWPTPRARVQADTLPTLPQLVMPVRRPTGAHLAFASALARILQRWRQETADPQAQWEAIDVQILLSPAEAARGGVVVLTVPGCTPCHTCGGSGREGSWPCEV
ncbi:MAG: DnaJ domain-containing protein, partial [Candidatus Binatia bacterium]|nr:DnaJ domain-containing protein [Candidatus Binatia bacterium]